MISPRTRYGLTALVCVSAVVAAFIGTASQYNPTFEGSRIEALTAELSRETGMAIGGGLSLGENRDRLILEIRFTPGDELYLNGSACLMEMKELMELAAIRYTGFVDEVAVTATASGSVPLVGDVPEARRVVQTVAELRRRFDLKQILESGDRLWPKAQTVAYRPWTHLVVHHSGGQAGSAEAFDRWHRQGRHWEGGMGYHFVIGNGNGSRDGQIEAGSRWNGQTEGAHAGSKEYNEAGVGICLVGDFASDRELVAARQGRSHPGGAGAPTRRQMESLRFLVLYLCLKLDVSEEHIVRHCDVRRTICPGEGFPMLQFRREIGRDIKRLRQAAR